MSVAIFHKAIFQEHRRSYYDGLVEKQTGRTCYNLGLLLLAKFSISEVPKQLRREREEKQIVLKG